MSEPNDTTDAVHNGAGRGSERRRNRAVKSTAQRVAEAEALLRKRQAELRRERELAVLRAVHAERLGTAKQSMKRDALIDALAKSYGIA